MIIDLDKMKKAKLHISLPVFFVLLALAWKGDDGIIYWLDTAFISEVEAEEWTEQIKGAVEVANSTSMMLLDYIRRQELRDSRTALQRLEDQLNETLLWESENGENLISIARKDDIGDRIDLREDEIECLVAGGSDCDQ